MNEAGLVGERRIAHHLLLIATALIFVLPFLWVVAAGFRTPISLLTSEFPFTPVLASFADVLFSSTSDFLLNYRNSIIVGLASTFICLLVGTLSAWSLHRMRMPAWFVHGFLGWAIIFNMIPPITLAGAWFVMFRAIGLDNSLLGLTFAHATLNLPMAVWLMGVFVRDVPEELIEAARIDGASVPVLFTAIVVPIVKPGLIATGILVFVFSWNEFAVALNLTLKRTATVPVAIAKFAQDFEIQYTQMAASATLSVLPALVLLIIGQRYIVKGLTAGAVK